MSRRVLITSLALLGLAAIGGGWLVSRNSAPEYSGARTVRYQYEVRNLTNRSIAGARLWVFAPVPNHPAQQLTAIESTAPYAVADDVYGNRVIEITLEPVPPYGSRDVAISATVAIASEPNSWSIDDDPPWTTAQPGIESEHPGIRRLATELRSAEADASIAATAKWIRSNLKVSSYDAVDRGAVAALEGLSGDCTEFAYLATALARAMGLPARAVDGWVIEQDALLDAASFHTWAEVWDGETWRLLDAHRDTAADPAETHYLAMRIVPSDPQTFAAGFPRFRYEGEGIVVRMK